jgi:C1A family cysteine protease
MRKAFMVLSFFLLLVGGLLFIRAQDDLGPRIARLNPEFIKAMELMQEGKFTLGEGLGYIPSPVDFSYYKGIKDDRVRVGYPTSYDLRNFNKVTPVKNQGSCGSCWAFGAMGSLESSLMPGETKDFSEQHLISNHGFDWAECAGGNTNISEAYLARWGGPYLETDYPYIYSLSTAPVRKHVQTILWLPGRTSSTDNDTIKSFLMSYGAVTFAYYYNASYVNYTYKTYYYPSTHSSNHEICMVGWDDNFDKTYFQTTPPGNGAFLCKNSWGTGSTSTDQGYFWLSYYDATINDMCSFIDAQSPANYKYIYQYDPLGWAWNLGSGTTTEWGANVFTASTADPLTAIAFIVNDRCDVTYYIYKNPAAGSPTSGTLVSGAPLGTHYYAGYYTHKLAAPVALAAGDTFSVVIKYVNNSYTSPLPLEGYVSGYSSGVTNAAGQSYYSSNGTSWTDIFNFASNQYKFNCTIKAFTGFLPKDDLLGTWDGQGVYFRNSETGTWMGLTSPADVVACGDLYGDGADDLIGIWTGQAWVKNSSDASWSYLAAATRDVAAADMNGDGRADFVGTWDGQGVYYKDSISGAWVQVTSPAEKIAAGDLDGDGTADLIGVWTGQGLWVKYSQTGAWECISYTPPRDFAVGDMNGDGRVDFLGTWDGQGVYYKDSVGGAWVLLTSPADQVAAGDLDGDGTDDLIGNWSGQGLWVKFSQTLTWAQITSSARDIAAGRMRVGAWGSGLGSLIRLASPFAGYGEIPGVGVHRDLSDRGPGGKNFTCRKEGSLTPRESESSIRRTPGPGEPGFEFVKQEDLREKRR